MSYLDDLADRLAIDAIDAMERTGDQQLIADMAKVLGASSQTTEEAFLTAVRVRLAEKRARDFLNRKLGRPADETADLARAAMTERTDPASGPDAGKG